MNREVLLKVFNDSNEMSKLIECLETKMKEDASNFLFETAAKYRDLVFRLNVLNNTIWRYTNVSNKDFVITIPVTDGVKYFYVSKGLILSKMTYEDDSYITVFLKECVNDSSTLDEKSYIDYRDIVCSEILNLPEDSLVSLS